LFVVAQGAFGGAKRTGCGPDADPVRRGHTVTLIRDLASNASVSGLRFQFVLPVDLGIGRQSFERHGAGCCPELFR
jgi:hypothetical protein